MKHISDVLPGALEHITPQQEGAWADRRKHLEDRFPLGLWTTDGETATDHIHGIYPPALEKQEPKPFLWSAHKRCSEITWVLVLGLSPVIVVGVIALLVWWLA